MLAQLRQQLQNKEITALQLTDQYLAKIEASNLDAWITINAEGARAQAQAIDDSGDFRKPLAGIPVGIKDVISTKGLKTTAASKILANYIPPYDATVTTKLKEAGAVILGKLNCDEFAMGSSTENSAYTQTKNPWDTSKVPGGSSGGSAAAVAGGECAIALGTDTGGSIRQPANFCGCVGLKPTYGRVSRSGVIPYGSSFDTIGPLANSVTDAAELMNVIAGHDPLDQTTPQIDVPDYTANLGNDIAGKIIGLPKEFLEVDGIDAEIKQAVFDAAEHLKQRGAEIVEVSIPHTKYAIPTYYLLVKAEASTNLARFDGVRFGENVAGENLEAMYKNTRQLFGPEVKRAIMMGTFALSAGYADDFYNKAAAVRALLKQDYSKAFSHVDAMIAPVFPTPAFDFGAKSDPLQMYISDILTVSANLVGIPSIAVPTGMIGDLPAGVQIMGPQFGEAVILNIGYQLEQKVGFKILTK